jgi:4-hydroxy-3-methylbut-2-en-1-yl diphosphate reductase
VAGLVREADIVLVLGSQNSSNSRRLMEIGQALGKPARLIDGAHELRPDWFDAEQTVLITAGASAPEEVVQECVDYLVEHFDAELREVTFRKESVNFPLPRELRVLKTQV